MGIGDQGVVPKEVHDQIDKDRQNYARENARLRRELARVSEERDRYYDRLEFDPGGSDKIDELEQSIQFLRHDLECKTNSLKTVNDNWGRTATVAAALKDKLRVACQRLLEYIQYHELKSPKYNGNRFDDKVWAETTLKAIDKIGIE